MNHGNYAIGNDAKAQTSYKPGSSKAVSGSAVSEIPHQLECLERTLKGCFQGLDTLSSQLESSVMRPEPPSPVGKETSAEALPNTPLGSQLRDLVRTAAQINARIESITQRLEV